MLFERNFSSEEKAKEKKVYFNPLMIDTKMMSEEEVKAEKYRKHFEKMIRYFTKFVGFFIVNLSNDSFLFNLWNLHFASFINITKYAETRVPIYGLVRKSIERAYINMVKSAKANGFNPSEPRIFLKFSSFLGEFFSIRHSTITPSLSLMEKCSGFLKALMTIDFASPFAEYIFNRNKQFITSFVSDMCE